MRPSHVQTRPRRQTHRWPLIPDGRADDAAVPGGLEEMFIELGTLPPDSITDPAVRAAISARYDSSPAQAQTVPAAGRPRSG
jgi:hypothetical protein